MGHKKLSFTTRFVLAFGVLLVAANILLGVVILRQSESAMKSLINKNMLDIVNTAAGFMDGDALGAELVHLLYGGGYRLPERLIGLLGVAEPLLVLRRVLRIHLHLGNKPDYFIIYGHTRLL